jgi:hypothetical protein
MRAFLVAAVAGLLLPGCEAPCGPSNCTGCCAASNECVGGMAFGACGGRGASCIACRAHEVCGPGGVCGEPKRDDVVAPQPDASTPPPADAGQQARSVVVTMRYRIVESLGGSCPNYKHEFTSCALAQTMLETKFQTLRLSYAACNISQDTLSSYVIDCTNNCVYDGPYSCTPDGQSYYSYTRPRCVPPEYCESWQCSWLPPS